MSLMAANSLRCIVDMVDCGALDGLQRVETHVGRNKFVKLSGLVVRLHVDGDRGNTDQFIA